MLFQKQNKINKQAQSPKPKKLPEDLLYLLSWIILWLLSLFCFRILLSHMSFISCHFPFQKAEDSLKGPVGERPDIFSFVKSQEGYIILPSGSFLRWHSCPPYCMDQVLFHHIHMPLH